MSMLDGVSQCWWLSSTCAVNWNAWAAIGTVAAVFTAIFAPSIQRRLQRKRANAIFAAAYVNDQLEAVVRLNVLCKAYPIAKRFDGWEAARKELKDSEEARERFSRLALGVGETFKSGLDGAKWPAVDQHLVLAVANCVESVSDARIAGMSIRAKVEDPWEDFMDALENLINQANGDFQHCGAVLGRAKAQSGLRRH